MSGGAGGDAAGLGKLVTRFLEPGTCVECFLHAREGLPEERLRGFLEGEPSRTRAFFESYRLLAAIRGSTRGERAALNDAALARLLVIRGRLVESLESLLGEVARANGVDFRMLWDTRARGEALVDPKAVKALRGAARVAWVLDNAGEAVIDVAAALVLASNGAEVYLTAKGEEYEVDVTAGEVEALLEKVARALGLDKRGVKVVSTGTIYPAVFRSSVSRKAIAALEEADIVIAKGIAAFEALTEECWPSPSRVIVALTAKCPPVAAALGVGLGRPVARLGYPCRAQPVASSSSHSS